jgi:hypothetical protein
MGQQFHKGRRGDMTGMSAQFITQDVAVIKHCFHDKSQTATVHGLLLLFIFCRLLFLPLLFVYCQCYQVARISSLYPVSSTYTLV